MGDCLADERLVVVIFVLTSHVAKALWSQEQAALLISMHLDQAQGAREEVCYHH